MSVDILMPIPDDTFKAVCNVFGYDDDDSGEYRCNAFFINSYGYLITNKEIALLSNRLFCGWQDDMGQMHDLEASVISVHPDYNLALIKVDLVDGNCFPFLNLDFETLYEGQWLIRISKSSRDGSNLSTVSSLAKYFTEPFGDFLPHEGIVNIGCNDCRILGSPYLNLEGNAIGVHCGNHKRVSFLTFLRPLEGWINNQLTSELK